MVQRKLKSSWQLFHGFLPLSIRVDGTAGLLDGSVHCLYGWVDGALCDWWDFSPYVSTNVKEEKVAGTLSFSVMTSMLQCKPLSLQHVATSLAKVLSTQQNWQSSLQAICSTVSYEVLSIDVCNHWKNSASFTTVSVSAQNWLLQVQEEEFKTTIWKSVLP
jgi:hypothetical protein